MFSELNIKMNELKVQVNRKNHLQSLLENLISELSNEEKKLSQLKADLEKENLDVEKLNKLSISSIFYTMLGKKEEKISKEEAEALTIRLKYETCLSTVLDMENHIDKIRNEFYQYSGCEDKLKAVLEEKKNLILNSKDNITEKILNLMEYESNLHSNIRELREAITSGDSVYSSLQTTEESLDSAKSWGTWDLFGGGLISDIAKHGHIDDAQNQAEATKRLLATFKHELADVANIQVYDIEIGSFATFADYFFDGLLADWFVQNKISDSLDNVCQCKSQITTILSRLNAQLKSEELKLQKVQDEIKQLIEQA